MKSAPVLAASGLGDMGILQKSWVLHHRAERTHLVQESEKLKEDLGEGGAG